MFPSGGDNNSSSGTPQNRNKYRRELERIRGEMAGFKPIDNTSKPTGNGTSKPTGNGTSKPTGNGFKSLDKTVSSTRMSVRRSRNSNNGDYFADEGEYY